MPYILAKDFYEQVHGHHQFLAKATIVNLLDAYREALTEQKEKEKQTSKTETPPPDLGN